MDIEIIWIYDKSSVREERELGVKILTKWKQLTGETIGNYNKQAYWRVWSADIWTYCISLPNHMKSREGK